MLTLREFWACTGLCVGFYVKKLNLCLLLCKKGWLKCYKNNLKFSDNAEKIVWVCFLHYGIEKIH
jgi:hypothetical protein